jgi:hypothetical protein
MLESFSKSEALRKDRPKFSGVKSVSQSIEDLFLQNLNYELDYGELLDRCVKSGEFEEIIIAIRNIISDIADTKKAEWSKTRFETITKILEVNPHTAEGAVLIAECCNYAAKILNNNFYKIKPYAIVAAWQMGAQFGFGEDEAYYLYTETTGTASFHDPSNEIRTIVTKILKKDIPVWKHKWSGIERQDDAFEIAADYDDRTDFLPDYAQKTNPNRMTIN